MSSKTALLALVILFLMPTVYSQAAPTAVLVSDNPADNAVARLLAVRLGLKSVVATPWGTLSNDSIEELLNLNASRIYVVGGEAAIPGVDKALGAKGISVEKRFSGAARYETAALVAREWRNTSTIIVAYGYDELGILDAVIRAKLEGAPLILAPQSYIPQGANEAISMLSTRKAVLIPSPDAIQNFLYKDLVSQGLEVEIVQQDHKAKTLEMISLANSTINSSETTAFTFNAHEAVSAVAEGLIKESRNDLRVAKEMFDGGMYNLAFAQAVLARFKAENSIKIKKGSILIPEEEKQKPKEKDEAIQIAQILLHPLEYAEKTVLVKAVVEEAVEVAGKAYIKLFDGTGRIVATFPADREHMLSKSLIFMAEPEIIGQTILVNGTVRLNVPLGQGEGHGAFAYLLEINRAEPANK